MEPFYYNGNFSYHSLENDVSIGKPEKYSLSQNYPNPFNLSIKINFGIPKDGNIRLIMYDVNGKEVTRFLDEYKAAVYYTVKVDPNQFYNISNLSSGIYFYRIESGDFIQSKKMMYLK